MLLIFASLLIQLLVALGFGTVLRYFSVKQLYSSPSRTYLGETALLGLVFIAFIALIANFVVPLNFIYTSSIAASGIAIFFYFLRCRVVQLEYLRSPYSVYLGLFLVCSYLVYSNGTYYDTGLYHVPYIAWIHQHAVVFGLGHLHSRFGFPSVWPLLCSTFLFPGTGFASVFSLDALLILLVLGAMVERCFDVTRHSGVRTLSFIAFATALLPFQDAIFWHIGSPSTDPPVTILVVYCTVLVVECLFSTRRDVRFKSRSLLWVLAIFAVLIKLSALPILILPLMTEVNELRSNRITIGAIFQKFIIIVGVFAAWAIRNLVTSGFLVYPVTITRLGFLPWAISVETARNDVHWITAWARHPGVTNPTTVLGNWDWVGQWYENFFYSSDAALQSIHTIVVCGVLLLLTSLYRRSFRIRMPIVCIILMNAAGLGLWFLTAPDFRFGAGFFFALANFLLWLNLNQFHRVRDFLLRNIRFTVLLVFALLVRAELIAGKFKTVESIPNIVEHLLEQWPGIPTVAVIPKKIRSGKTVNVPTTGDQCWNAEIPCTPYYNERLVFKSLGFWSEFQLGD